MAFDLRKKHHRFTMIGGGALGLNAQFGFCLADEDGQIISAPLFTVIVVRNKSRGFPGFEASGIDANGNELFWLRGESTLRGHRVRISRFRSSGSDDMSKFRDKSLAALIMEFFFAKRCEYRPDDAVNSLTWHLAKGNGEVGKNLPEIWMTSNYGYQDEAIRMIEGIRELMDEALAEPQRYTDEMLRSLTERAGEASQGDDPEGVKPAEHAFEVGPTADTPKDMPAPRGLFG